MRDFSWKYFMMTGDVDAYLLYKEAAALGEQAAFEIEPDEQEEALE
ncbi:YqzL family protein [Paenibacillus sp. P96]|uniref:YqzL family protein n=1 Tax=Paenibacillus zeirhizosphaerae TaxID=2987519 RepID=A0ABT9FQH2_9BACL|nr:YqzL family protein [Paenibacillus sp. P96]MDP4096978.1 YqzL family protein [Paenibacillus sp. P96]